MPSDAATHTRATRAGATLRVRRPRTANHVTKVAETAAMTKTAANEKASKQRPIRPMASALPEVSRTVRVVKKTPRMSNPSAAATSD